MSKKRTPYNRKARHSTGQTLTQERPTGIILRPVLNTGYSNGGASAEKQAMRGYWPIRSSPKSDVDVNLNILRNRSADMAINSPVGAAAINRYRTHVVGAGLVPSPCPDYQLLGITPEEALKEVKDFLKAGDIVTVLEMAESGWQPYIDTDSLLEIFQDQAYDEGGEGSEPWNDFITSEAMTAAVDELDNALNTVLKRWLDKYQAEAGWYQETGKKCCYGFDGTDFIRL